MRRAANIEKKPGDQSSCFGRVQRFRGIHEKEIELKLVLLKIEEGKRVTPRARGGREKTIPCTGWEKSGTKRQKITNRGEEEGRKSGTHCMRSTIADLTVQQRTELPRRGGRETLTSTYRTGSMLPEMT